METTLKHFMEKNSLLNMPLAKCKLLEYKKRGLLFFTENVGEMQLEDKFQLFYCLHSNSASEKKAFPIPKHSFLISRDNEERYEKLKRHFEDYYLSDELDKKGFEEYDLKNPYIGEDYVWVYKRTC